MIEVIRALGENPTVLVYGTFAILAICWGISAIIEAIKGNR